MASIALAGLAGPAAAQERQWTLDASDQDAYLVFGVPESDDVGISLWCTIRTGSVNIFLPETGGDLPAGKQVAVILKAGKDTAQIQGKTEVNEDAGVPSVEAKIPADHSFFKAMATADRFHVQVGKEDTVFPLMEADIGGLLALCRKP